MLTFGIEEEYFITDLHTRQMLAAPSATVIAACREAIGEGFTHEIFQGQIEAASPVFHAGDEAAHYLETVRRNLARALADFGLGVVCAGSHPLADWREQRPTEHGHFRQLFEDVQYVARRSVLCGLHALARGSPTRPTPWVKASCSMACTGYCGAVTVQPSSCIGTRRRAARVPTRRAVCAAWWMGSWPRAAATIYRLPQQVEGTLGTACALN